MEPKLTQLCPKDQKRRKEFHDQAVRANKGQVIANMEEHNHAPCSHQLLLSFVPPGYVPDAPEEVCRGFAGVAGLKQGHGCFQLCSGSRLNTPGVRARDKKQQYDWCSISQTHAVGQRFADDDICEPFTWEDYVDYHQSTDCPSHLRFSLALSTIAFFCVF